MIIIEPFYECYGPMSQIAGAKCRYVALKPGPKKDPNQKFTSSADWTWDVNELEAAFNSKTKIIVINTPNNPLGIYFSPKQQLPLI
jgi:kynurenine--oxoglutarate transaminase/cysteine-S-conjugate beta-lyase/glutamine--phenylpyruvate transaminase